MIDLEALEALEAAATPGPWMPPHLDATKGWLVLGICADVQPNDAALIAAARNALPELLAEIRRLRAVEEAARALITAPSQVLERKALRAALAKT